MTDVHDTVPGDAAHAVARPALFLVGAAGAIVGTLFIRSFERGERISIAMASRGFTGTMPEDGRQGFSAAEWLALAGFAAVLLGVWLWP